MTTTTSKTPASTCQICGRPIKANSGVIAHHGYKRPGNGWQTASCYGARHMAYEQSNDALQPAIDDLGTYIARMKVLLADFIANPPAALPYTRGTWNPVTTNVERPADFDRNAYRSSRMGAYDTLWHARHYEITADIKSAEATLVYLHERLAAWVAPAELTAEDFLNAPEMDVYERRFAKREATRLARLNANKR